MSLKKRIIALFLTAVMLVTGLAVTASAAVKYGDINNDGSVNATDALFALKNAVGKQTLTQDQMTAADVDGSKKIDASDALLILQYAVGKILKFPVEDDVPVEGQVSVPQIAGATAFATPVAPVATDMAFSTLTQINMGYSPLYDLDIQCILAYAYGFNSGAGPGSWVESKHTYADNATYGLMVPVNRDDGEYLELHPERGMKDVQTKYDGTYRVHSYFGDTAVYYMVPSDTYIEYKWEVLDSYLSEGNVEVIALEEPELWNNAGYSEGFKEMWKKYYGTDWEDPDTSAEAMWKSQYLKAWLFKNAFEVLSQRIKANYPDVKVLVTTHSNLSYSKHGISTGAAMYAEIDTIDGVIGQTWSDDASQAFAYGGNDVSNIFMNALFAYNSYGEILTDGQALYLLQDPSSDNPNISSEDSQLNWMQTVVAAMMQNDTTSFQSTIWPQRAFQAMGMDYKTIQLNVNRMYEEFNDLSGYVYSGTPGVTLAASDSMGWHLNSSNVLTGNSQASISGIYYSLQNDGIQVDTVYLDNLTSVEQLKDVSVLILSYDAIKPMNEDINKVIAQWVKEGGRLLYLGGHDAFADIDCEWWGQQNTTPYKDLIKQLGLTGVTTTVGAVSRGSVPSWSGSSFDDTSSLNSLYTAKTVTFDGTGFKTFMKADGKNVGITADVGEGRVVMVGLPSSYYSLSMANEMVVRELTAYALKDSGVEYSSSQFYAAQRGDYFAYYSANGYNNTAADRTFVNLFSANLDVIPGGSTIPRNEPVLWYDVTEEDNDTIPRVAFTGGTEMAQRLETAETTQYTITNPSSSVAATVILANGKFPQTVTATTKSGKTLSLITSWEDDTETLLVKANNPDVNDPITFTVTWGDTFVQLPSNYVYESFNVDLNYACDDPFYYEGNNHANDGCYFMDLDTYAIWKIDLKEYIQASVTFDIMCNYAVYVSFDGTNWKTVENWADKGGPVGNLADGSYVSGASNRTTITVSANSYAEADDVMYIKVGSCYMYTPEHPGGDHGANIYTYSVTYLKPAE